MKIRYQYNEYKNCPEATEISHSRTVRGIILGGLSCCGLFISLILMFATPEDWIEGLCVTSIFAALCAYMFIHSPNVTQRKIQEAIDRSSRNQIIKQCIDNSHEPINIKKNTEQQEQNPYLGNVTYDMVVQFANETGLYFSTAQKLINFQREAVGIPPICFEERPAPKHPSGGIWDDPDIKINLRDK